MNACISFFLSFAIMAYNKNVGTFLPFYSFPDFSLITIIELTFSYWLKAQVFKAHQYIVSGQLAATLWLGHDKAIVHKMETVMPLYNNVLDSIANFTSFLTKNTLILWVHFSTQPFYYGPGGIQAALKGAFHPSACPWRCVAWQKNPVMPLWRGGKRLTK